MMNIQKWLQGLIIAFTFCCLLLLWAEPTLAQVSPSDSAPSAPAVQPEVQPSSSKHPNSKPTETTTKESSEPKALSTPFRQQKTYKEPPHPYNMDAIEAYNEEVYGAGR